MISSDVVSAFSVFDPKHLPEEEHLTDYGVDKLKAFMGNHRKSHFTPVVLHLHQM